MLEMAGASSYKALQAARDKDLDQKTFDTLPHGILSEKDREFFSLDDFLGGQLRLLQPIEGYRISMDSILLAAAIPARKGDSVFEPGIGTGGVSLSLAERVAGVKVTGLDVQPEMLKIAEMNGHLNTLSSNLTLIEGDVSDPPEALKPGSFDHVVVNPPYLVPGSAFRPPSESKGLAHMDSSASLKDWMNICVNMARHKGTITIVHRTDMLHHIIARIARSVGDLTLLPLQPRPDQPAKRFILQGRKGTHGGMSILPALELHGEAERYSKEAEAILRGGKALLM